MGAGLMVNRKNINMKTIGIALVPVILSSLYQQYYKLPKFVVSQTNQDSDILRKRDKKAE